MGWESIRIYYTRGRTAKNSSSVFNSIPLASSNDGGASSDFGDYCAKVIMFGLSALGGGLSTSIPII